MTNIIHDEKLFTESKFNMIDSEIKEIKEIISHLKTEIFDIKEAFEQTDDSLHRVRYALDNLKSGVGK